MAMEVFIGLDIGGTKVEVAAAGSEGEILARRRAQTPLDLGQGIRLLHSLIGVVSSGYTIRGMGAAIGGPLDWETGIVSPLHQPAWRDVPLRQIMQDRWACPFCVDVDTNVAALAEYHFGEDKPSRLLYLTISTGMGGGYLQDGLLQRGMGGAHPEVGHQSIPYRCSNPAGLWCECGAPDCLEALISGNGIQRIYGKPAEELGKEEWQEVAYNLGQGLRNLATIYLPDIIVLGGSVALGGGEQLVPPAVALMRSLLNLVPAPQVQLSRLGHQGPLLGAIHIARHGL